VVVSLCNPSSSGRLARPLSFWVIHVRHDFSAALDSFLYVCFSPHTRFCSCSQITHNIYDPWVFDTESE